MSAPTETIATVRPCCVCGMPSSSKWCSDRCYLDDNKGDEEDYYRERYAGRGRR